MMEAQQRHNSREILCGREVTGYGRKEVVAEMTIHYLGEISVSICQRNENIDLDP